MQNRNYAQQSCNAETFSSQQPPPKLEENLKQWNKIDEYSRWMYSTFSDYIGKRILDVGVGIGNITRFYIEKTDIVICGDIFDTQLELVRKRFSEHNVETMMLDIEKDNTDFLLHYQLDTVVCINVLEHIEDDLTAVKNMAKILNEGGHIILFVPAINKLYNFMDRNAGHYRRYDKGQLEKLANRIGLKVIKQSYFNIMGIVPYSLKGWRKRNQSGTFSSSLNETNSKIYNYATKILAPIEKRIKMPIGLSQVVILKK